MPRRFQVTVDGHTYEVEVSELADAGPVAPVAMRPAPAGLRGGHAPAASPPASRKPSPSAGHMTAPLPGVVLDVKAAVGDRVSPGDVLVILEAMKMENEIAAASAGVVQAVHVVRGASVAAGDPLVTIG